MENDINGQVNTQELQENPEAEEKSSPPKKWKLPKFSKTNKKQIAVIFLVALCIVGIIAGTYLFQYKKKVDKRPLLDINVLLAEVDGKKIYKDDVKKIAEEQYYSTAIDNKIIKYFLDKAIERVILDQEAIKLKISESKSTKDYKYYQKIKDEIINKNISKIQAIQIGWWIPPPNLYPEQTEIYDIQRKESVKAVEDIKNLFSKNTPVMDILSNIYNKYPSLQTIIALNGVRYKGKADSNLVSEKEYNYDSSTNYFPNYKLMRSMNEGEIKGVVWDDGSGAVVIKVIKITQGEKIGYDDWLNSQIKTKVVYNKEEIVKL